MKSVNAQTTFVREWPLIALALGSVFEYRFGKSPSVTLLELISLAVLLQMFLDRVALGKRFDLQWTLTFRHFLWPFVFVGWIGLLGMLAIPARGNTLNFFLFREFFPSLVIIFAIIVYRLTLASVERLLWIYFSAAAVVALIGLSQMLTGMPQIVPYNWAADLKMDINGRIITDVNKATGFAAHPNLLASFFIFPVGLGVWLFLHSQSAWRKAVVLLLVVLMCIATYGTHAKGGWSWVLLVIFLMVAWPRWWMRSSWSAFFLAAVWAGLLLFGSLQLFEHGYKSFATLLTRVRLWEAAWFIALNDPYVWLLGNGQEAMPYLSKKFSDIHYPNAHSGLVNIFLFYGVGGTLLLLTVVAGALNACRQPFVPDSFKLRHFSWLLALLLSIYFWNALFEPHLEGGSSLAQFFLCIGLCYGHLFLRSETS